MLGAGGSVTNQAGGLISGGNTGLYVANAAGTVTNAGTITGMARYGIILGAGGSVTNQAGGAISGGLSGVYVKRAVGAVTLNLTASDTTKPSDSSARATNCSKASTAMTIAAVAEPQLAGSTYDSSFSS